MNNNTLNKTIRQFGVYSMVGWLSFIFVVMGCQASSDKHTDHVLQTSEVMVDTISPGFRIKVIETQASTDDLPLVNLSLRAPNAQLLPITQMNSVTELSATDYERHGIPHEAVFAVRSFYAGVGVLCYGTLVEHDLSIYEVILEEDGSRSDREEIKRYRYQSGQWMEEQIPITLDADDYRDQQWHPEEGKYYFSKQYIYAYFDEQHPDDDPRRRGTFSFYIDEPTGTILLTRYESYADEMTDYVLIRPGQDYIVEYVPAHGPRRLDTIAMDAYYSAYPDQFHADVQHHFAQQYQVMDGDTVYYGLTRDFCVHALDAQRYHLTYIGTDDESEVALAPTPYDLTNLYLLGKSDAMPEGGLHIPLHQQYLPYHLLVVADTSIVYGKRAGFKLECISKTSYYLDLSANAGRD